MSSIDVRSTTPASPLSLAVKRHMRALQPASRPEWLTHKLLDPRYAAGQCHANTLHAVCVGGGERIFGWLIWEDSRLGFVKAEFHSIWRDPAGNSHDITPRPDREEHVLFLPDPQRRLDRQDGADLSYPNRLNGPAGKAMAGLRAVMGRSVQLQKLLEELGFSSDQSLA